jgi:DNA-binding GntR family transcriptional regulator
MDAATRADPVLVEDHQRLVAALERADLAAAVRVVQDHAARPRQLRTAARAS